MVERKTGVAREICHPHKYTSVHVYDSERKREEEKERERERLIKQRICTRISLYIITVEMRLISVCEIICKIF